MSEHSRRVAQLLKEASEADRARARYLNDVAEGRIRLTPEERDHLVGVEQYIQTLLKVLGAETTKRLRVVGEDEYGRGTGDRLPRRLTDAYELVVHAAYGSDPAVSTGDPTVLRGIGRVDPRTSTNQPEGVGGSAKPGKRPGIARRNVIKDRAAYELKIRADRRLRKLAQELEDFLAGGDVRGSVNVCTRCARIGEDGWRWCPHCGHEMGEQPRVAAQGG
jgi:hypothetical protein